MDVQKWLERGLYISREITELRQAKCIAMAAATDKTQKWGDGKNNKDMPRGAKAFARVAELSMKIDEKIVQLTEIQLEIIDTIYKVSDIKYRTILLARYINLKSWGEIARELSYSEKWVRGHLHTCALEALKEKIEA